MDTQSQSWYDVIGKFRANAAQFAASYTALLNSESVARKNPALYSEWKALKSKADGVKATVQKVTGAVDTAARWLKENLGLGVFPALIPVAVVVSAVAAMTYVIADISKFLMKAKQFEQVAAQVGPEKAAAIVSQANQESGIVSSIGASAKSVALLVALVAGVYYLPKLLKK